MLPGVDPHQPVQDGLDLRPILDLDEQRRRQLVFARDQIVIDLDLFPDLGLVHDPLDPAHLLDLEEGGLTVLEDEAEILADLHPAPALQVDDAPAHLLAHLLVLVDVLDVRQVELFHSGITP